MPSVSIYVGIDREVGIHTIAEHPDSGSGMAVYGTGSGSLAEV